MMTEERREEERREGEWGGGGVKALSHVLRLHACRTVAALAQSFARQHGCARARRAGPARKAAH